MIVLGIVGLVGILSKVSPWAIIKTFQHAKPAYVILFLLNSVMVMVVFTLRWLVIMRSQGHNVPFKNLFIYRICGYGIGAITPTAKTGGEPVRIMLLKRHGINMKDRVFSVLTDKILETSANFIFFVIGLFLVIMKFAVPKKTEFILIVLLVVFAALIGIYYTRMLKGKHFFADTFKLLKLAKVKRMAKYENRIIEMEKIMINYFEEHKLNFSLAFLLSMLGWVFTFGELKYALSIVGITQVSIAQIFIILSFLGIAFLIPIPLAIGSLEALQISTFKMMNFQSAPAAVAMAFMIRVRDLLWTIITIIALSYFGFNFKGIVKKSLSRVDEDVTRIQLKDGSSIKIKRPGKKGHAWFFRLR